MVGFTLVRHLQGTRLSRGEQEPLWTNDVLAQLRWDVHPWDTQPTPGVATRVSPTSSDLQVQCMLWKRALRSRRTSSMPRYVEPVPAAALSGVLTSVPARNAGGRKRAVVEVATRQTTLRMAPPPSVAWHVCSTRRQCQHV